MLCLFLLFFGVLPGQAQSPAQLLKDAEALYDQKLYDSSLYVIRSIHQLPAVNDSVKTKAWLLKAKNHNRKREYQLRLEAADKALSIAEKQLKGDGLHATALRAKGDALIRTRSYDSAIHYLQQAEQQFTELEDWSQATACMVGQGVNHYRLKQYLAADSVLNRAMILMEQKLDQLPSVYGTASNVLGVIYRALGDHEKALINYQAAVRFHEKRGSSEQALTAAYNNLGTAYFRRGDFDKAEEFLLLAEIKANEEPDHASLSNIYNNLMLTYTYKKAYGPAGKYGALRQELITSGKAQIKKGSQANFYNNLALLYLQQNAFDKAKTALDQALSLNGETAQTCANLGYYYYRQRKDKAAKPWLDKAIEKFGSEDQVELSKVYRYRAIGASRSNKPDLAALDFDAALEALMPAHSLTGDFRLPLMSEVRSKRELLRTLKARGEYLEAHTSEQTTIKDNWNAAIALADSMYLEYKAEGSRRFLKSELMPIYENTISVLIDEYQATGKAATAKMIYGIMERSKSNLLLDLLQVKNSNRMAGVPRELIEKEKALQIDIDFFRVEAYRAQQKGDSTKAQLYRNYELEKLNEWDRLIEQFEYEYPNYANQRYRQPDRSLAKARLHLDDSSSMLIEFFTGPETTYALAITQDQTFVSKLGSTDSLRTQVLDFIQLINQPKSIVEDMSKAYVQLTEQGHLLYKQLLAPLMEPVDGSITSLTLIPDGYLNLLSFEALLNEAADSSKVDFINLPYLIKAYEINYSLAASLLGSEGYFGKKVLAMAPFGNSELPNTQNEVNSIRQHLEGTYYPNSASEWDFVSEADQYGILHLATHGIPDEQNPQLSYLAFNNTGTLDSADQKLYSYELENMDLKAQLVVLSACETGSGQVVTGEGVMSLARAFSYTGVESVVMSLWRVDDKAGSQLMDQFYAGLVNDLSKSEALREAKLQYLSQSDQLHAHPYFWSQFVLVGDNNPLIQYPAGFSMNFTVTIIMISVGLVIFLIIMLFKATLRSSRDS